MSTSVTFNGTAYSIPASGETGWSSLSSFLIDVGNNAQSTSAQKGTIRIATSSPVTISSTDYTVLSDLTVPGAVAVTLPAGVDKTIYVIGDANGDAQTYNITITPASGLINDAATYVIKNNYGVVALQYSSAATMWKVIGRYFTKIDAANETYGILGAANGGTGIANNAAATLTRSGNHALTLTTTGTTGLTLPTTGTVAVTADKLSVFAATTSAELAGVISNETGSGLLVFNDTPTLIAPVLGAATGTSLQLSGLTASRAMVTDGSKNLASSAVTATELGYLSGVTTPTGSGALVLATSPTLVTPVLGVATATSINKVALTAPATSATLTIADGKTLTASNTLTLTGTDASSVAFGTGGTVTYTSNNLSVFAATTSAQLAGVLSDETGSGLAVFGTSPTFLTSISLGAAAETRYYNAGGTFYTGFKGGNAAANKIWTLPLVDGASGTALKTDGSGTLSFGAVAGGGSVNYITESDFEDAATTGWVLYADAAGTVPVNGVDGSANVTVNARAASAFVGTYTASGVNPLRGTYSMEFAKDAANRQGQGTSIPFTIAYADISKPLRIDFECDAGTTYTASDMGVYVYDITNSTLITPSSVNIPGGASKFSVTFNATTSVSYRLIFHVQTTNATAYYLKIDSVSISPNVLVQGAAVGDWQSYTPSNTQGFGTLTSSNLAWARSGPNLLISGKFVTGTVAASEAQLSLPSGLTIDSTGGSSAIRACGKWVQSRGSANSVKQGTILCTAGNTYLNFSIDDYTTATNGTAAQNGNAIFGSTETVTFTGIIVVPISSWTSNTTIASSRVEFSSNYSTATAANDTTSFSYGPAGDVIQNITSTVTRRVRFLNAIQPTDDIRVEWSDDRIKWIPLTNTILDSTGNYLVMPYTGYATNDYGFGRMKPINSTDIDIAFGTYSTSGTSATYGAAGTAWSGGAGASYWRVRKSSGIGAGEVALATSTSAGYVDPYQAGGVVTAGTWTPTVTNVTNMGTSTVYSGQCLRVGKIVSFTMSIGLNPTATGATAVRFSLPIASAFTTSTNANGLGRVGNSGSSSELAINAGLEAAAATDDLSYLWYASVDTDQQHFITGSYIIL